MNNIIGKYRYLQTNQGQTEEKISAGWGREVEKCKIKIVHKYHNLIEF